MLERLTDEDQCGKGEEISPEIRYRFSKFFVQLKYILVDKRTLLGHIASWKPSCLFIWRAFQFKREPMQQS